MILLEKTLNISWASKVGFFFADLETLNLLRILSVNINGENLTS